MRYAVCVVYVCVGVPDSCFSEAEALFNAPHDMYWRDSLMHSVSDFFTAGKGVGQVGGGGGGVCVASGMSMSAETGIRDFEEIGTKYLINARKRYGTQSENSGFQ